MKITSMLLLCLTIAIDRSPGGESSSDRLAAATFRTGDSEIFIVDPISGDSFNPTKSPQSSERYPSWSPDGERITFRLCDEVYRRDGKTSEGAYRERRGDKRPVRVMSIDGSNPRLIEPLHYQTTIDGSRAPWRPR